MSEPGNSPVISEEWSLYFYLSYIYIFIQPISKHSDNLPLLYNLINLKFIIVLILSNIDYYQSQGVALKLMIKYCRRIHTHLYIDICTAHSYLPSQNPLKFLLSDSLKRGEPIFRARAVTLAWRKSINIACTKLIYLEYQHSTIYIEATLQ